MSDERKAPTAEEILEELRAAGIDPGQWGELGGHDASPLLLGEQVRLAKDLKGVLEAQERLLQKELQQAKEALHRVKHGGGS